MRNQRLATAIFDKYGSQRNFAEHVVGLNGRSVSNTYIGQIINGKTKPGPERKKELADLLDSTVEYLFGE